MKLIIAYLIVLVPVVGVCQGYGAGGLDDTDLIDDTKERPGPSVPDMSKQEVAQIRAEIQCMGKYLDTFYSDCGRYPTTQEGLQALVSKPKTLKCEKWGVRTKNGLRPYAASLPRDALRWEYTSLDGGASYTVKDPLKSQGDVSQYGGGSAGLSADEFLRACGYKDK
jgi:hypothetical protein